ILGYAEQLKQTTGEKAVEAIYQSSEYLHQIVNEILDYSKITAGKYTLEKAPFNCIAIINNVADAARAQALKKELEFTVNIQPDLNPCLVGDAFRLKQVLFNLLGNAIKFTEHGSVRLDVLQEIKGSQATLRFSIADTGPGIAQADIDTIFNLFEQGSSPAGKQAGTGLGLSIVKELVQLQGGSVKVDSRIGEGSVFTFVLPYTLAQAASSQPADANALPAATGTGKILFVDDDPLILELCRTILEKHTITGVYRHQPEEILNAPWDDSVVTAFLDMRMPKINGAQLCAFIKQQAPPGTKVYALTAQALPNEREAILNQGFDGIIIKPFKEDQLLRFIGNNAVAEAPGHSENDFWLLQRMTGGDPERMKSILRLYLEETAVEIALLDGYKQGKNIAVITEALHKLAGRIGQVGATELAKQLRLQERKLGSMPGKLVFDELDLLAGEVRAFNEKVLQYVEAGTPVYTETRY
ncbi:MAG TPA: ATP-binding protein, partial [Bacteroidia bacterium]|nr:ATP-binding protein [Bacteroidia bacterium]